MRQRLRLVSGRHRLRWAAGLALAVGLHGGSTFAGVLLGGTRVIFNGEKREASISMRNLGSAPYVMQAWIDAGEGKNKTPFMVTPPLSRLDPGKENSLRILRVATRLPADRESVFWLNVKEIPEKSEQENVLQMAVRSRIKLFYRPPGLDGKAMDAQQSLRWAVGAGDKGDAVLKVANPTPYHVTLTSLDINEGQQQIDADMLMPFAQQAYPLTAIKTPQSIRLSFSTLDDHGGETPRQAVQVPVAHQPLAAQAQAVEPPVARAKRP